MSSGLQPFQAKRRGLAIEQANGSSEELTGNVRVCGAHFISGEASMDVKNVDSVPTVFNCNKHTPKKRPKKVMSVFFGRRRRRYRKSIAGKLEAGVSEGNDSSDLMETDEPSSEQEAPSDLFTPEGGETMVETAEPEATFSPFKISPSIKIPASCPSLDKMMPVVLLKPLEKESIVCDLCGVQYTNETWHQCAQPKEPSFSCNMCDRSFPTVQSLKRHKLLHVRDKRKCGTCGVLFCRRHPSVFLQAVAKPKWTSDDEEEEEEEEAKSTMTLSPYHLTTTTAPPTPQSNMTSPPSLTMKETLPKPQSSKTLPHTTTTTLSTPQSNMTSPTSLTMKETLSTLKSNKTLPHTTTMRTPPAATTTVPTPPATTTVFTLPATTTVPTTPANTTVPTLPANTTVFTLPATTTVPTPPATTTIPTTPANTTVPTLPANTTVFTLPATTTVPSPPANTTTLTHPANPTPFKPPANTTVFMLPASSTVPTLPAKAAVPTPRATFLVSTPQCTMTASPSPATRMTLPSSAHATVLPSPPVIASLPTPRSTVIATPLYFTFTTAPAAAAAVTTATTTTTGGTTPRKSPFIRPVARSKSHRLPKLYSSMKFFSPRCLTSAFIEVERHYTYVQCKTEDVRKEVKMEEPFKLPPGPPVTKSTEQEEFGRIAYDLDIVI